MYMGCLVVSKEIIWHCKWCALCLLAMPIKFIPTEVR